MEGLLVTGLSAALGSLLGAVASAFAILGWLRRHPRPVDQDRIADAVAERIATMQSQAWFWTSEWQEGEREADEDIAAGRTTVFKNTEDFMAHLDRIGSRRAANA